MKPSKFIFLISLTVLLSSSCNSIISSLYGVKNTKMLDIAALKEVISDNDILNKYNNYYIDSSYVATINKIAKDDNSTKKNLHQPMQAMYFNTENKIISYHINCNAGGFPNLKWNRNNVFGTYPPQTQTVISQNVNFQLLQEAFKPLNVNKLIDSNKTKIVVFWNYQFYRQCNNLIKLVEKNVQTFNKESEVQLYFVNTDFLIK